MAYALREEPIDTARRHVRRAECLVVYQRELVQRLRSSAHIALAAQADAVLGNLKTSLALAREDLANLKRAAGRFERQ
jgi:hypothetical protein